MYSEPDLVIRYGLLQWPQMTTYLTLECPLFTPCHRHGRVIWGEPIMNVQLIFLLSLTRSLTILCLLYHILYLLEGTWWRARRVSRCLSDSSWEPQSIKTDPLAVNRMSSVPLVHTLSMRFTSWAQSSFLKREVVLLRHKIVNFWDIIEPMWNITHMHTHLNYLST